MEQRYTRTVGQLADLHEQLRQLQAAAAAAAAQQSEDPESINAQLQAAIASYQVTREMECV